MGTKHFQIIPKQNTTAHFLLFIRTRTPDK